MNNNIKKWLLLATLSIIWGSSFILIKKGLLELTPIHLGSLRIIFTTLVILSFSFKSLLKIKREKWKWIIITAYVGTFFPVYLVGFGQTQMCYNRSPIPNKFDDFLFGNDDNSLTTTHPHSPPIDVLG